MRGLLYRLSALLLASTEHSADCRGTLPWGQIRVINPLMGTLKPHSNRPLCSNTVIGSLAVNMWTVTTGTERRGLGGLRLR